LVHYVRIGKPQLPVIKGIGYFAYYIKPQALPKFNCPFITFYHEVKLHGFVAKPPGFR